MLAHKENDLVSELAFQKILQGVVEIIEQSRQRVAVYVNQELTLMYWHVGKFVLQKIDYQEKAEYGKKIVATLSQQLTERYGKGFTTSALFRMLKVARVYPDEQIMATLSQQLTWSHFVDLITIEQEAKRLFYQQMSIEQRWSTRLRLEHRSDCVNA
jgi:hypothetical protein